MEGGSDRRRARGLDPAPLPASPQAPLDCGASATATLHYAGAGAGGSALDAPSFFAALTTRRLGRVLLSAPALPSTQALLQGTGARAPDGAVAVADAQSAGKGRGANAWTSPPGCLAASLTTTLRLPGDRLPFVQYVVSLAALQAARDVLGGCARGGGDSRAALEPDGGAARVRIKWPNDLYADGAKLGVVLCHSRWGTRGTREGRGAPGKGRHTLTPPPFLPAAATPRAHSG